MLIETSKNEFLQGFKDYQERNLEYEGAGFSFDAIEKMFECVEELQSEYEEGQKNILNQPFLSRDEIKALKSITYQITFIGQLTYLDYKIIFSEYGSIKEILEDVKEDYKEYSEIENLEFLNDNYKLIECENIIIKVVNSSGVPERKKTFLIQDWSNH